MPINKFPLTLKWAFFDHNLLPGIEKLDLQSLFLRITQYRNYYNSLMFLLTEFIISEAIGVYTYLIFEFPFAVVGKKAFGLFSGRKSDEDSNFAKFSGFGKNILNNISNRDAARKSAEKNQKNWLKYLPSS